MKLIDADALITQIRANIVQAAAAERGAADPTYMAWLNAVLHLMTEEVEEAPESDIRSKLDALYKNLDAACENAIRAENVAMGSNHSQARYYQGRIDATAVALMGIAAILEGMKNEF